MQDELWRQYHFMHNDRLGSESTPLSLTLLCKKECYWACLACKGKQKSMAHNEGCGDHRRKYRKRKIGNGRQRKTTNWCGKKRPFTENCQPPAPSHGGERKKKGKLTCHGRQRTMVAKKTTENLRTENREKKIYGKNFTENNPSGHL